MKLNAMENFQFQHVLNETCSEYKNSACCQLNTSANTGCLFLIQKHKQQSGLFGG